MPDDTKKDPLEGLLVDEIARQNRAKELLAGILSGRVVIHSKTGELDLLPEAYEVSASDTILILLCAKLAQKFLSSKIDKKEKDFSGKMPQGDILKFLGTVEAGTIKSSLFNLRKDGFIKNEAGENYVAESQLPKISERLQKKVVGS